jgi:hypothetical protein
MYGLFSRTSQNRPAYSWAVNSLVVLLIMNIFIFSFAFDLVDYLPFGEKFIILSEFGIALFIMAAYVLVVILINVSFKEKDVRKIEMGEREKRRGYILMIVYVVLLFTSIFILPFIKKG